MEDVGADLVTPADVALFAVIFLHLRALVVDGLFVDAGAQDLHREGAVLDLGAFALAGHDNARRDVRQADRGLGLIDVLAALAAGTVDVDAQVGFVDLDVDVIIDFRDHVDGGEGRVATGVGVERGDADEAMDAALGLDVAVGVGAFEAERSLADARAFAFGDVFDFDLKAATFSPAGVHAVK